MFMNAIITRDQSALIQGALDSLGAALTNYGHEWTDGERAIYEEATAILDNQATCQRCGKYIGGSDIICCCAPE